MEAKTKANATSKATAKATAGGEVVDEPIKEAEATAGREVVDLPLKDAEGGLHFALDAKRRISVTVFKGNTLGEARKRWQQHPSRALLRLKQRVLCVLCVWGGAGEVQDRKKSWAHSHSLTRMLEYSWHS